MLAKLFFMFLKIGFLSVGGGYPMMAMILQEGRAVGLTSAEFADMTALEMLASGPIAINAATYVGYIRGGVLGSIVATAAVCSPAFVLTSVVYFFLSRYNDNIYVQGFLRGIRVACGGVLLAASFTLGGNILIKDVVSTGFFKSVNVIGAAICAVCALAVLKFKINPIAMVLVSAVLGAVLLRG
jgi:chromate transporter